MGGHADELMEAEGLECLHNLASVSICFSFEVHIYIPSYCDCYRVRSQLFKQLGDFFEKCCCNRLRCWAVYRELERTTQVFKRAHVELEIYLGDDNTRFSYYGDSTEVDVVDYIFIGMWGKQSRCFNERHVPDSGDA